MQSPREGLPLSLLRPRQSQTVIFPLVCRGRGAFVLGGYRLRSDFPFGLLQSYRVQSIPTRLIVPSRVSSSQPL